MSRRRCLALVLGTTALHALIAGLATTPLFFKPSVATAVRVFGGGNGEENLFEDVRAYRKYGLLAIDGQVPYRDYDIEYPVGAVPLFIAPGLVAHAEIAYRWAFAAEMMLFDAAIVWLLIRRGAPPLGVGRTLFWYSLLLGLLGAVPIARFDIAAALMAFAATIAWDSGRGGLGGILAGLGGLTKLFPLAVAGPGVLARRDGRIRSALAAIATVAIGAIGWLLVGGPGVARSLRYHSERGLENESLYAGVLVVIARAMGWRASTDINHWSVELLVPGASFAAAISPFVQLAAMAPVLLMSLRGASERSERPPLIAPAGACILAFALFGKVLSPQYVLWILPFAVALEGRAGRWTRGLLLPTCILTTLVYFWAGVGLVRFHPLALAILNVRNALLLALFAIFSLATARPSRWLSAD